MASPVLPYSDLLGNPKQASHPGEKASLCMLHSFYLNILLHMFNLRSFSSMCWEKKLNSLDALGAVPISYKKIKPFYCPKILQENPTP
ncbi:unnamed protein product [Blepharisma stoltei]|uniref:Uncharacterized protein n=1 Tax=Blepharisma stoltei TaxID=1481888 RepID=A0AAU9J701_9CILI|nr:unnamed protein product [Blepharisma stoltei]